MKLPWYVKSFYDKEKKAYYIRVNKWWAVFRYLQIHLFISWINKNYYLVSWGELTDDIEVQTYSDGWGKPNSNDATSLEKYRVDKIGTQVWHQDNEPFKHENL